MTRLLVSLGIMLSASVVTSAGSDTDIKASISRVTVFPDRAQIFHETAVNIPAGNSVLRLPDLSPYIDVQSIQVKGYGDFTVMSVNHQNNYLENLEELPEIKKIRAQIEDLQLKVEDEKASVSVLKEKEAFLIANRAILVKEISFTIDQMKSVMDLYTSNMDQVTMSVLKKNRLIKDYEKQIALLQKQIADRSGRQQLPSGEITVSVSSLKPVQGKISFSYVVTNAGWYPSYDIRVDDITKPVNIFYKANVFQRTGVEWNDVKLSFSNATPWVSGDVPQLNPWFIDYYTPPPPIVMRKSGGVKTNEAPMIMEMAADDAMGRLAEAAPVIVDKQVGTTTVTFDVAVPYSVKPDGKIQTIEIQRTASTAEYKYVTVPKLSPLAYLTGEITNWAEQSLQSGEATLYFENSFVGKSYLNVNQLTDTLVLSLGTDNSILVKREKQKDFTSRKVLGSNKTEVYSFLITIRNNKPGPITIVIHDQIPISSNSGITVEATELTGGKLDSNTGEIKWDLEIRSGETRQIILTYSVKYPKERTIILE